jgi:CheY-like chemotaxis protein
VLGRLLLADPESVRADLLAKHLQAVGYQVQVYPDSVSVLRPWSRRNRTD